jgi:hypothetical protein
MEDEIYIYKGEEFTRKELEGQYGDRLDEAIDTFGIKKKDLTQSPVSLAMQEGFSQAVETDSEDIDNEEFTKNRAATEVISEIDDIYKLGERYSEFVKKHGVQTEESAKSFPIHERIFALQTIQYGDDKKLYTNSQLRASADRINKLYKTASDSEEELININQQDKTISFDVERYRNALTRTQAFSNQIKKIEREEQEFIEGLPDFIVDDLVAASTSAGRAVVNLFDFASILYDAENVSDRQIKNQFKTIGAKKGLGLSQEQIDKGIAGSIGDGDISAAFTNLVVDGAAQIPQLAAAVAVGAATRNPTLGMNVYSVLAGANAGAAKYAELISDPTMSETGKVLSSVAVGVTEALASRVFTGGTQSLIRRLGASEVRRNMPRGILSQARAYGLPLTKGIADEALEEGFAQGFESFIIDHVIRGEEFNPYAVADAMIIGAVMGGSVTSATLLPSYRGSYKTAKRRAEIANEIKEIRSTINSAQLTETERKMADDKIFNLRKEANDLRKEDAILYKDMSREDMEKVIKLNRRISLNRDRAIDSRTEEGKNLIKGEIALDIKQKEAIEKKYDSKKEEQVSSTEQAGEAAVETQPDTEAGEAAVETGGAVQLDEETKGELDDVMRDADSTVSEQEAPTRKSKTEAYASEDVQGGIINLIKTKGGELGREFVGAIERIKSTLGEGYKVVVLDDARYRDVTNTTGRGAFDTKNKVLYLNAQQVRNLDKDNVRAVYHEAIHPILTKRFGEASAEFVKFKQDLVNAINRSLSGQDAATLIERLEAFEKQYKKDKTTEQQAEEFMTELGAIMASEDVELLKKSGLLNRVKELINNLLRKLGVDISLDTENDVVEFMNSLAQGVRGGVAVADIVKKENTGYVVPSEEALQESRGTVAINPDDVRSLSRAGSKVGMGLKKKTVKGSPVIEESEEMSIAYAREANPEFYLKIANQLAQYPLVSGVKKLRKVGMDGKKPMYINYKDKSKRNNELKKADEVYNVFKEQVKGNLRFLMDNASNDFKELMTLWYDGANKIASDFSSRFGYTVEQAAGVMASLSPQKDWYQNVKLAELVMEGMRENPTLTQAMIDKMISIRDEGYKLAKKKGEASAEKYLAETEKIISELKAQIGTSLNEMPNAWKPHLIRLNAEVNKSKNYDILLPDGNPVAQATKEDGTPSMWAFGSFNEIGKAVSILLDGSQDNISAQLGSAHKIRNFYNNIIDPMSEDGDITMDTHAVAASLFLPLSGNSSEVNDNLSGIKSLPVGLAGNYFAHADAYRELAEEMGYLPRQIQSITWEVVRGLYTKGFKGNKQNVNDVREIFDNFAKGKITIDEARNQAAEKAGGFSDPTWGEFVSEESRNRSRQESERRRSDELRRDAVRRGERGGLEETPLSESRRDEDTSLQESRNLAPNGQPSNLNDEQYKIVRTPEFKRWFGDWENDPENASKVVDENGEPLVVYHGTKEDFDKFEPSKISQGVITGQQGIGFYFTQNKKEAESYGSVKEIFLSIKNPFKIKERGKGVSVEQVENILSKGDYNFFFEENLSFLTRSKGMNLSKKELIKKYAEQLHQGGDKDILKNLKRAYTPESYSKLMNVQSEELGVDGAVEEVTARTTVYVTYAPSQSKLADGSNRTFDPEKEGLKESRNFDRKTEKAMEGKFYKPKIDERFNKASKRQMANKKLFDRQGIIRRALQDANDLITQAALSVRNGSSAAAKKMYERFNKNIFLNVAGKKKLGLNEIIMLRRIISIYDGFDRGIDTFQQEIKDLEAKKKRTKKETERLNAVKKQLADLQDKKANFKNPRKLNRESALARLDEIKQDLRNETGNDQQFFDMDNRASRFFDAMREILKRKLDEGLITQDEYFRLSKYEYSPRMFVDKVFDLQNGDFAKHEKRFMGYGLSEKEFKKLKEGSEEDLFMEGDFLLRMVVAASENRVFANRLFKQLGKKVGSYEWLSDTKKNGFSELTYKEDGESRSIYVRNDIAEEIENADSAIEAGLGKVGKYFGTNILRAMATGYNPLFPLSNIPMDFANVVMFTDTYDDKSLGRAMIELSRDFSKNLAGIGTITAAMRGTRKADPEVLRNLEEAFEAGIGMDFLTNQGRAKFKSVDGSNLQRIGQKFGDFMSSFGENSELAMRLSVYNKVKADSLKKRKDGDAQFKDMNDAEIRAYAAFKARATIDFSQGGSLAKSLDKISPYFNASLQGLRVAGNYIRTNPAKFGKKFGESALYAITMSFVMQHLFEMFGWDDDDKEAIPEYHKRNYFIIPLPFTDDDGNKKYIKIRKLPQLAPLLGIFDLVGEATYNLMSGQSEKNNKEFYTKGLVDFENTLKAATVFGDMVLEFDEEGKPSIDVGGVIQYSPPVAKAMGQYITNYDFFRERDISYEKKYNLASPEFEGKFDDNVEEFYKEFGELTGMSPKRTKNAVEVVTTSPSTNLIVGVGYGIANAIMAGDKSFKDVTRGMEKRAVGTANKKYIKRKPNVEINNLLQEYKDNQFVVREELTKMVLKDKAPKKDVIEYVNGIEDKKLREYAIKKYKKLQRKNKFDDLILDKKSVYYNLDDYMSEKPELAAEYLFKEFGSLTNQELREVASYISMIRGTKSFSYPPAFMSKYRELQK